MNTNPGPPLIGEPRNRAANAAPVARWQRVLGAFIAVVMLAFLVAAVLGVAAIVLAVIYSTLRGVL